MEGDVCSLLEFIVTPDEGHDEIITDGVGWSQVMEGQLDFVVGVESCLVCSLVVDVVARVQLTIHEVG